MQHVSNIFGMLSSMNKKFDPLKMNIKGKTTSYKKCHIPLTRNKTNLF